VSADDIDEINVKHTDPRLAMKDYEMLEIEHHSIQAFEYKAVCLVFRRGIRRVRVARDDNSYYSACC
jgi:hypothetical protein